MDLFSSSLHLRRIKTSSKTLGFSTRTSTTNKSMNKTFAVLTTLFCMHAAHGYSTNAEAFALLKLYRRTHPSSVTLIHHRAHRTCASTGKGAYMIPRVYMIARVPVFLRFPRARRCIARFDRHCTAQYDAASGRRIQMRPGRPLRDTALHGASAALRRRLRRGEGSCCCLPETWLVSGKQQPEPEIRL